MTISQLIYQHALLDLGLKETDGRASTPRIKLAIKAAAEWLEDDDSLTAWCGCIRGLWGIETKTGAPEDFFRARNWLNWGEKIRIDQVQQGDTVIMQREGGFHVGLYSGPLDGLRFTMLGGNQSNRVSIAPQPKSLIVGVRRRI